MPRAATIGTVYSIDVVVAPKLLPLCACADMRALSLLERSCSEHTGVQSLTKPSDLGPKVCMLPCGIASRGCVGCCYAHCDSELLTQGLSSHSQAGRVLDDAFDVGVCGIVSPDLAAVVWLYASPAHRAPSKTVDGGCGSVPTAA